LLRNAPPTTHTTVALAILDGHNQVWAVPEFFMNLGSLSIQAEYLANHMDNITAFQTQPQGMVKTGPKSYFNQAAYVQVMYFLTGEHRPYNKTALHSMGAAPTRVVPYRNFFWVPGNGGCNVFSMGAWQVGVRYCYSDLTNNGINGGQINEVTFGLNWFLNPNMKIQWNYDIGYRGQLGPGSDSNGTYYGFGARMAVDF
jgi:phosphate-selective porin OprO/OprP